MENLTILSYSASSSKPLMGFDFCSSSFQNPTGVFTFSGNVFRNSRIVRRSSRISVSAQSHSRQSRPVNSAVSFVVKQGGNSFASVSSSRGEQTTSVGHPNVTVPTSSSSIGSPLFWIGVGVGLSALFSLVTSSLKKYAMQTAMKTMMNQMNMQNNPPFPTGSPFPIPRPIQTNPTSTFQSAPQSSAVTVDVTATQVDTPPSTNPYSPPAVKVETANPSSDTKMETKTKNEEKNYAFVDISPEETTKENPFSNYEDAEVSTTPKNTQMFEDVLKNGAASQPEASGLGKGGPGLSVEALEKMMEDPTVQKMVYPHLPEEMRNPETFKWMLQNPQYRQQLQDMLNNMSGSGEWDNRMMDTLKNFDLNSPQVKQQFGSSLDARESVVMYYSASAKDMKLDQIGMTPEEVISKIMANPDVAVAFQNPRVQAALMECSENPMNIMKYQNDKEVMDVFNKISQLFPGMTR